MCAAFFEPLESRQLLAGVTLITHGRDGHLWGFNQTVANEITTRVGGPSQAPQYILKLTPETTDGPLIPTITKVAGTGWPQSSTSGEIILLVDWTSVDDNPYYQLSGIADLITNVFMNTTVDGVRLAELPLHGVSISRGTGLLDEIAWSLGHNGVWVDQLTYCDPNPVELMGDASPTVYDNVAFVDNYWRWDGDPNNQSTNGSAVAGAYNLNVWWLDNTFTGSGWETKHIVPGGYYVGTINTTTTNGGEGPIFPEWYGTTPDKPARTQTGFIYTSIIGAARPLSGVWTASGGTGTRTETGWEGDQWANVTDVKVTNGTLFNNDSTININYLHQDRDTDSNATFFLDADRNPYNGAFAKTLGSPITLEASDTADLATTNGSTSGVANGSYYVVAKITDAQGHTRFSYSKPITITGSTTYMSELIPTTTTNGWGPFEKDRSNGENGPNDGRTITLNGQTYAKGLGVHANSNLTYELNKQFVTFNSDIGIDDEKSGGSSIFQVWLDGVKAYDSGIMTGSSVTKSVSLNVSNATTMRLVVTDGGNGNDSDHADWANARLSLSSTPTQPPPPPPETTTTFLSALNPTSATNGWGSYERDKSNGENGPADGNTLSLNGTTYTKGLGVHANSDLVYNLGGQYSSFVSDIGVDDEAGSNGSIIFQVYLDGAKVYDSGVMTGTSATKQLNLSTSGKSTLRLVVTDAGNGATFDHGDWAGARLLSGTDTTPTQPPPPSPSAPPAPINFNATYTASIQKVQLSWGKTTDNQTGYRLERKLGANGTWGTVALISQYTTGFTDTGPFSASSTYFYRIFAFNSAGESAPSAEKSITTSIPTVTRTFLSDMTPIGTPINGWGPYERDRSNGEADAGDGRAIMLNGSVYGKGLGVHANSDISFNLNKQFRSFTSDVGIDDETAAGSVIFQVYADGVKIYDSGAMAGSTPTRSVNVSVTNVTTLRLVVTDAGNGNDSDHADWANAAVNP